MNIRSIDEKDLDTIAKYEIDISKISFGEDAITDLKFHKNKLLKAMESKKDGMYVMFNENEIIGWLWMTKKTNYISGDDYINFKSFYINEKFRGDSYIDVLLQKGIEFAYINKAKYIVGKVNIENISMRLIYKKFGFKPTHLTMELKLGVLKENEN